MKTHLDKFGNPLKIGDWILSLSWSESGKHLIYDDPRQIISFEESWSQVDIDTVIIMSSFRRNGILKQIGKVCASVEKLPSNEKKRDQVVFLRKLEGPQPYYS